MGSHIIKCHPDRDQYVYWSDQCEAPHTHGTRAHIAHWLNTIDWRADPPHIIEQRLDRADHTGTSCVDAEVFGWDDDTLIVEQRGILRRDDLWEFCELWFHSDSKEQWLNLLQPLN